MRIQEFFKRFDGTTALNLFAAPILLTHELAHYVPARLFGLHPRLHWRGVAHGPTTPLRYLVITLCPSVIGMILMMMGAWLWLTWAHLRLEQLLSLIVFTHGFGVWVSGGYDWIEAWRVVMGKEYGREN